MSMVWEAVPRWRPRRSLLVASGVAALFASAGLGAVVAMSVGSDVAPVTLPAGASTVENGVGASGTQTAIPVEDTGKTRATTGTLLYSGSINKASEYCEADSQVLDVRGDDGSIVGAFQLGPEAYSPDPEGTPDESGNVCSYDFTMDLKPSQTYTFTLNGRPIKNATYVGADVEKVFIMDIADTLSSTSFG